MTHEFKIWVFQEVRYILAGAGIEIIHAKYIIALFQQTFAEVRTKEAGSTGYQDSLRGFSHILFYST